MHLATSNSRDPELEEVLARCATRIQDLCKILLPNRFDRPWSNNHERFFEAYNDESIRKLLVIAHRGWGKTSIINYAVPIQNIIFRKRQFIVPTSATSSQAISQAENLKKALTRNNTLKALVGDIRTSEDFSKESWTTSNDVKVLPRSPGQQVRGINFEDADGFSHRMELGIFDDIEQVEGALSDEQRSKLKNWFLSDFSNSVDRPNPVWRLLGIGTIVHQSSLLCDLRDDPSWTVLDLPLCDDSFKTQWEVFMSDSDITSLMQDYRQQERLTLFYMEYMNQLVATEEALFHESHFKYYDPGMDFSRMETFIIVDPTKSDTNHSAYSAIVGISYDDTTNSIYIRDVRNERITADELYNAALDMAAMLGADVIGIEVTGLDEFIKKPFIDCMMKRGANLEVVWLKARKGQGEYSTQTKGKSGRIKALVPYYRMGHIWHNPTSCAVLEKQLLDFPYAKYIDVADAAAYMIELTELGERYFEEEHEDMDEGDIPEDDELDWLEEPDPGMEPIVQGWPL